MKSDLEVETEAMCRLAPINKVICRGDSEIQKFYENAIVLLTGGTGFLGKHLIEKLFRSCNIKKLYLLVRQKNNKTTEQRLAGILDDTLFEDLYKEKPNFACNIETVNGDISEIGLGMCEGDRQAVTTEVDIIIHVAAAVQFTAPLKKATIINVRGTREMLRLAKECKKLRSFVHISTAFSNATYSRFGKEVLDDFYPSPISPTMLIDLAEGADSKVIDSIAPRLIQDWPNTYTFTKAVTEELLRTMADGLPVCIVRPSIVINAYTEPRPGWIDKGSLSGPTGLVYAIKMGLLHQLSYSSEMTVDCIPVDYISNMAIAAGWETGVRHAAGENDLKIYPVCSTRNRLKWDEVSDILYNNKNGVSSQAVWYSFAMNIENKYLYILIYWLLHLIPAYLVDGVSVLLGRKPGLIKLYTKIQKQSEIFRYFTTHEWIFRDGSTQALYKKMSSEDQIIFNFNILSIDWREMMRLWPIGLRRFILKDGLKKSEYARKKQFWLKMATYILFGIYVYIFRIALTLMFSLFNMVWLNLGMAVF